MQVISPCIADEISLKPGTYYGEVDAHPGLHSAESKSAAIYSLWPSKHIVPVTVTTLVEQGFIRSLD